MNHKIKNLPSGRLEIEISVEPSEYQNNLEKAARNLKDIKIDGFRPGQAPYELVKNKLGETKLLEVALEDIVSHTFFQIVKDNDLNVIGAPEIKIIKMAPQNPLVYQAVVDLLPELTLPDLEKIKIEKKEIIVSEEDINQALTELQTMRSKESLINRPAQKGDKVEIDYNISLNNVPIEGGQQKKFPIYLGEQKMIPGLDEQIYGLKTGEEKEFPLQLPENFFNKNLAGKTGEFKIKVHGVFQIDKEEINDDFAGRVGTFKNLAELKKQLSDNIKIEKDREEEKKVETTLIDNLIDKTKFGDIPENLIKRETQIMIEELKNNLANYQINFQTWLNNLNKKEDDLIADFQPQALRRVQAALIMREIIKQNNLQVTAEEIEAEIEHLQEHYIEHLQEHYQDNNEVKEKINSRAYRDYLKQNLLSQKAMSWLKEKVVK